jgi:hypothetical protein
MTIVDEVVTSIDGEACPREGENAGSEEEVSVVFVFSLDFHSE